jgi:hypothetical protein
MYKDNATISKFHIDLVQVMIKCDETSQKKNQYKECV